MRRWFNNSEAGSANVCFSVYQSDGTNVVSVACTNVTANYTVSAYVTPKQNGTYVVVVYAEGNDATVSYNLEVSCYLGTCPTGLPPPSCVLKDALTYNATSGTLTMNFTVGLPAAATWNGWLTFSERTAIPLVAIAADYRAAGHGDQDASQRGQVRQG